MKIKDIWIAIFFAAELFAIKHSHMWRAVASKHTILASFIGRASEEWSEAEKS